MKLGFFLLKENKKILKKSKKSGDLLTKDSVSIYPVREVNSIAKKKKNNSFLSSVKLVPRVICLAKTSSKILQLNNNNKFENLDKPMLFLSKISHNIKG